MSSRSRKAPTKTGRATLATMLRGTVRLNRPTLIARNKAAAPRPVPMPDMAPHSHAAVVTPVAGTKGATIASNAMPVR